MFIIGENCMYLKNILIFISAVVIGIFNSSSVFALEETDATSEKYLIDHGHSKEIIRMINLQKSRAEGNMKVEIKENKWYGKLFKNLWYEQDVTLPITDFGHRDVKTPETDLVPVPKKVFSKKKPKEEPKSEIEIPEVMINDVNTTN